ncbi:cryptochrome/photolyase family protein [Gellertiella hungarica]|uniref:Deoxyribodipyrimidine photo-lyase n=1 Tax=Gellertiella hungarica TaxID=1572859 RepID=A0A7W6J575_9HYPH|nr:deoxyribodipyrimidine photo-lyase [Gellertiella hungarica]MBB4065008.1 deoxyribodipyrimidine photo-lyase [Gellertiella hungarica]
MASSSPLILWFRKDLRLDDHIALIKAARSGRPVIPVFILADEGSPYAPLGAAQRWWLNHSLEALARSLEQKGSRLVLRRGAPETVLAALAAETGANVVAVTDLPDPAGRKEDERIAGVLEERGVALHGFGGLLLHDPEKLRTGSGGGFRVYTPFWRALNQQAAPAPPRPAPDAWTHPARWPESEPLTSFDLLPRKPDWAREFGSHWTPGEKGALDRLHRFTEGALKGYAVNRDRPGIDGTSGMSPHLAMGEVSPRRIWAAVEERREGERNGPDGEDIERYQKELVWREFSYHLLHHFPELATRNWTPAFDSFSWVDDPAGLEAWKRGLTGYPIVDAGMRQLWRHGWMHNRVRMIVASFLIKDLLIDWRVGEKWFRDTLVDADPGSNAASWQWVAGSGADASPFFRIFNPILQGEKFDPDGTYVRTFVPELSRLPTKLIHRPFEASLVELRAAGISLGSTYPRPVVDHRFARDRALAALAELKAEKGQPIKK